jgi:selenocysteine lyase/cysteine desulfurase
MRAQEIALSAPLLEYLRGRNDVRLIGRADPAARAPTIAVSTAAPAVEVATRLARHGIMAGAGDFYAVRALEGLNLDPGKGVLRLSFTHYTSREDVDRLVAALDAEL